MLHDVLVIPGKPDIERDAVAAAWEAEGGNVLRVDRFWERPAVASDRVALYGADSFCLVLAQLLGLQLVSPADDLLLKASPALTKRSVRGLTLKEALVEAFPVFVKPLTPKAFRASVWSSAASLVEECRGLPDDTPVLASEVVQIDAEARAWVLDGEVVSCALYEGAADLEGARDIAIRCARELPVPATLVIDVAHIADRGWCVLEANAAWGAGLNGCDPAAAAKCIDRATRGVAPV